jgi:hypothetical protein
MLMREGEMIEIDEYAYLYKSSNGTLSEEELEHEIEIKMQFLAFIMGWA